MRFERGHLAPSELRAAGAEVVNVSDRYQTVTAALRPPRSRALARVAGVEAVTGSHPARLRLGGAGGSGGPVVSAIEECYGAETSEGDTHLKALEARQTYEVDGTGSTVGILSDSYDTDELR